MFHMLKALKLYLTAFGRCVDCRKFLTPLSAQAIPKIGVDAQRYPRLCQNCWMRRVIGRGK